MKADRRLGHDAIALIRRLYGRLYIRQKIFIAFALTLVVLLSLLGFIAARYAAALTRELSVDYTANIVGQSVLNIDSFFNECNEKLQAIANNEIMVESLEHYQEGYQSQIGAVDNFKKILLQYNLYGDSIEDIVVIQNGQAIYNTGSAKVRANFDFLNENWFVDHLPSKVRANFVPPHEHQYYHDMPSSRYVLSAIIPVKNSRKADSTVLGYILMDIKLDRLTRIFDKLEMNDSAQFFMLDQENQIVYHADETRIAALMDEAYIRAFQGKESGSFSAVYEDTPVLCIYQTAQMTDWKVLVAIELNRFDQYAMRIHAATVLVILIGILSSVVVAYVVTSRSTKTISLLMRQMEVVGEGDFQSHVEVQGEDEMAVLARRYNEMVNNINHLMQQNTLVTIRQKEAEMEALQSKINPHFLYNTLQTIHSMAVLDRTQDIEALIEQLGELFDYTLYENRNIVRLEEELKYIRNYLNIYQNKYVKRFDFAIEADEAALAQPVPKLLLQPLVENALIHGLKESIHSGHIDVRATVVQGEVVIEVEDNGCGMSPEKKEALLTAFERGESSGNSLGMRNVYDRLKLIYQDAGRFEIEPNPGGGTRVTLRFPAEHTEEDEVG